MAGVDIAIARRSVGSLLLLMLASCGGGGGGGDDGGGGGGVGPGTLAITYDTGNIAFQSDAPFNLIATTQRITGRVTGAPTGTGAATLYILVEIPPNSFFTVPEVSIDGVDTGHAVVSVRTPQEMGSGVFQGSLRIRACLNSANCSRGEIRGSPFTVNVSYNIGDVIDADTVTPRVVPSGIAGEVILRGHGFTATSTVSFGATPASSVTFRSGTELRATFPALPAGSYPVAINSGAVAFTGALVSVDTPAYAAAWIPHLHPAPFFPTALVYDAERRAFIYGSSSNGVEEVVRYEYSGGDWTHAGTLDNRYVKQLRFSQDGTRLLGLNVEQYVATRLLDLDPVTLAVTRSTTVDGNVWTFALANDGNYVLARLFPGSGRLPPLLFGSADLTAIEPHAVEIDAPAVVASGDGSKVVVFGPYADAGVYDSSAQTWTMPDSAQMGASWENADSGTANLDGTRFAVGGRAFDANLQVIGDVNGEVSSSVLSPDGSRLYVYDQGDLRNNLPAGTLRTFDLNAPVTPGFTYPYLAEVGTPVVLANNPNGVYTSSTPMKMTITPDGRTVLICGVAGCAVQPTPP